MTKRKREMKDLREKIAWLEHLLGHRDQDIEELHRANEILHDRLDEAIDATKRARDLADKLLYINDVLCAELKGCDRCIDTVRMGLEQKSANAELLNRITGTLV